MMKNKTIFKILFICSLLAFNSCKVKEYIPIVENATDTIYLTNRDSIQIYDSIYIKEYLKNDTVFLNTYKYKYIDKIKIDTIFKTHNVYIKEPYPVIEKHWYDNYINCLAFIGLITILSFLLKLFIK